MNILHQSIGALVASMSNASVMFNNLGIDTQKDSDKMLCDILHEKNIECHEVVSGLNLLNQMPQQYVHWFWEPAATLINHIKECYHRQHRQQLPLLIDMARQVESENRDHPSCPTGLYQCLNALHEDLLAHMDKEEQIVFPILAANQTSFIYAQICMIMHNHDHDLDRLHNIDTLTQHFRVPDHASRLWSTLYDQLVMFKENLLEHIRLEDHVLFARHHS